MKIKTDKETAIEKLHQKVSQISNLLSQPHGCEDFQKWERSTTVALRSIFGDLHRNVDEFSSIRYSPTIVISGRGDDQFQEPYARGLKKAKAMLESMIEEVSEYFPADTSLVISKNEGAMKHIKSESGEKDVFIVHGRDELSKESMARIISKLGYNPIILHEQGSGSLSLIEKFEHHSNACFAIALLTPDDIGGIAGEAKQQPRARQNVIFELGYFIGKLSRSKVCAFTKGDIEIPSDYKGVAFVELDPAGAWRMQLVRNMKAAGLEVDANEVI